MKVVWDVAKYSLKENARSRSFTISIIFVLLVFASAFIFSRLSEVVEVRVIEDVGLAAIQFFSLITAIFFAIKVGLGEIQNKTIYMALARPVSRTSYLFGRFLGICLSTAFEIAAMGVLLTILLIIKGATFSSYYFLTYLFIFLKISMITALSLFVALLSTSFVSAFVVSFLAWLAGHLLSEVEFFVEKLPASIVIIVRIFKWILPNFTMLNLLDAQAGFFSQGFFLPAFFYALFYSLAVVLASSVIFRRKEI